MTGTGAPASPSVLRMAAPLVVSFWMRAAVTLVDTIYAARIGDAAVAAVGLTVPLEFLMIALWVGLSTGLTSGLSRALGAREGARIAQYLGAAWRLVAGAAPLFTAVGAALWLAAPHLGLEPGTARAFQIYGTVLVGGSAFTTFWSVIPDSLVKAHQDTRSTMWAGIWTNVINVGLNTLFLFAFGWGVFGIALSTVLGRIGGLVYALARARFHEARRHASNATPGTALDAHPYRTLLSLAVPSAATFALVALETGVVNALLARMPRATETLAAYSIYYRVVLFSLQPVIATGVAMLPYAARRFGEDDVAGVRRGLAQALGVLAAYSLLVLGPAAAAGAPWLAARLSGAELTQRLATFALYTVPLACLAGGPFLLCRPVFEAMGRGRPGLVMAAFRYVALTGPLAWSGLVAARAADLPPMYGLVVGLLGAAAVSSVVFWGWVRAALSRCEASLSGVPAPDAARPAPGA